MGFYNPQLGAGGFGCQIVTAQCVYLPTKPGPNVWGPLEIMDFSVDGWELQRFAVSPRPCSWQEESGQLVSQRLGVLEMNVISEGDGRCSIGPAALGDVPVVQPGEIAAASHLCALSCCVPGP